MNAYKPGDRVIKNKREQAGHHGVVERVIYHIRYDDPGLDDEWELAEDLDKEPTSTDPQ